MFRKLLHYLNYATVPFIAYTGCLWLLGSIIAQRPLNIGWVALTVAVIFTVLQPFQKKTTDTT